LSTFRPVFVAGQYLFVLGTLTAAQQPALFPDDWLLSSSVSLANVASAPPIAATGAEKAAPATTCRPLDIQNAASLTFRQRACFYEARLMKPSFAARAALFSTFSQLRNEPRVGGDGAAGFAHRFGAYYARRAGQSAGELLAGYLNHEDPRYHPSHQEGFWNRTKAALLSVTVTHDADGATRPAFGPIAGAFGSGMVSVGFYRTQNGLGDGFRRTGLSYGCYFGTALFREFKPDLALLASHALHRKSQY
jgi:hypothetical protein